MAFVWLHPAGVLEKESWRGDLFAVWLHLLHQGPGKERNWPLFVLWCLLLPSARSGDLKTCLFPVPVQSDIALHYTLL